MSEKSFQLFIKTENDAFDGREPQEVARILREVADRLEDKEDLPDRVQVIRDRNGNDVGRFGQKAVQTAVN